MLLSVPKVTFTSVRRLSSLLGQRFESYVYAETGDPVKVLRRVEGRLPEGLGEGEVLVRMLAAPINPADINMIQGSYAVKPKLPAVGGNEGVGEILEVGCNVTNLSPRDWVIPSHSGWGTWKTHSVCPSTSLRKIPNDLPLISAATLSVNPCTAFRMLKDFVTLSPNDVVIQNGANSGVGQAVIQIAAALSLKTINVVRTRPNLDALVKTLTNLGATHVVTNEQLKGGLDIGGNLWGRPKLGLNCVGGKDGADLLKTLGKGGVMVTYGGMSRLPLMVPTGSLIFSDVRLAGFWMTRWNEENMGSKEMGEMWRVLGDMVKKGKLVAPKHAEVGFGKLVEGVERSMQPFVGEKQIVVF